MSKIKYLPNPILHGCCCSCFSPLPEDMGGEGGANCPNCDESPYSRPDSYTKEEMATLKWLPSFKALK